MVGRPRKNPEFPPPPPETAGERLATERRRLGHTQEQLAETLRVALSAVQKWEQGRNAIKTPILHAMRKARINVDYVIFGKDRQALEPLDAELWERVKAWDAANPNDVNGTPLNEYARYQRISLFYRWLQEDPTNESSVEERLSQLSGQKAA
jgi:transcriptional regulator with XRE-family HTH domain